MLQVKSIQGKGRGYIATTDIPAGVEIHVSEPLATVVSVEWLPETCLYCFDFSYPKKQKVKAVTPEHEKQLRNKWHLPGQNKRSLFKDIFFCSEECKSRYDPLEFEQLMVLSSKMDIELIETTKHVTEVEDDDKEEQEVVMSNDESKELKWIEIDNADDDTLSSWLNNAWSCLVENLDMYKEIDDTERTMCRLIAACLIRKYSNNKQQDQTSFEQLFQIQNNESSHFKSFYKKTKLPIPTKNTDAKEIYQKYTPQEVLNVMKTFCFFARATSSILPVDHATFRDIYFRERSNSFGLWEKSNDGSDSVTDDLELLGWGIYPSAVYFNHSCDANVIKKRQGRKMVFVTRHTIEKGQEACISYGNVDADLKTRRARLYENYNFTCQCTRCLHEEIVASLKR